MAYNEIALANAQAQELTSADVAAMGYLLIAELAEVTIDEDGGHPADPDFYYTQVRSYVVSQLAAAEWEIEKADMVTHIKSAINNLPQTEAGKKLKKKDVTINEDGEITIL